MKRSTLKAEYMKERRRIQNFIYRAKKKGYVFKEDVLPKIPKKITKQSISRLQKITPKKLYTKTEYLDIETGEIIATAKHQADVRKQAVEKAKQTKARKLIYSALEKITPEEYDEYLSEAHYKYLEKREPQPEDEEGEYIPTFDITEEVKTRIKEAEKIYGIINAMERKTWSFEYPIEARKNALLEIMDETLLDATPEQLQGYEQWLQQNESEIAHLVEVIMYQSTGRKSGTGEQEIEYSFARLGEILNTEALNSFQQERLSQMSELYNK